MTEHVYAWAAFFAFFGLVTLLAGAWVGVIVFFLLAALVGLLAYLRVRTSEFAVTNKRVLIKVGVLSRRSLELLLTKIEGIGVNQDITGRVLDFGTIVVIGTGGTKEPFKNIAKPLAFRKVYRSRSACHRLLNLFSSQRGADKQGIRTRAQSLRRLRLSGITG